MSDTTGMSVHPVLEQRAVRAEYVAGSWGERYVVFERGDWAAFKAAGPARSFHGRAVRQHGKGCPEAWSYAASCL